METTDYKQWLPKGARGTPAENRQLLINANMAGKKFVIHDEFLKVLEGEQWPNEVHAVNYDQNTLQGGGGWGDYIYYSFAKRTAKFIVLPYVCEADNTQTIYIVYEFHLAHLLHKKNPNFMKKVNFSRFMDQPHFNFDGKTFGYYFGYTSTFLQQPGAAFVEQVGAMAKKFKTATNFLNLFGESPVTVDTSSEATPEEGQTSGNMFFACLPLDMRLYQYRFRSMIAESQFNLASKVEEYALKELGSKTGDVKKYVVDVFDKMKKAEALNDEEAWKTKGKEALRQLGSNMQKMKVPNLKIDGDDVKLGDLCDAVCRGEGILQKATDAAVTDALNKLQGQLRIIEAAAKGFLGKDGFNAILDACQSVFNQPMFEGKVCHLINFLSEIESWLPCVQDLGSVFGHLATGAAQLPAFFEGIPFIGTLLKESGKQAMKFYGHWLRPIFLNSNVSGDLMLAWSSVPPPAPIQYVGGLDAPTLQFTLMSPSSYVWLICGGGMRYYKVTYSYPDPTSAARVFSRPIFFPMEMFPDPNQAKFPQTLTPVTALGTDGQYTMYVANEPTGPNAFTTVCFYLSEQLRSGGNVPPWGMALNNNVVQKKSIDIRNAQRTSVRRMKPKRADVRRRITPTPSRNPPRRETPAPGTIERVGNEPVYWI